MTNHSNDPRTDPRRVKPTVNLGLALRALLLAGLCVMAAAATWSQQPLKPSRSFHELWRIQAPEARQGPAADADSIYLVSNQTIAKFDKTTRARLLTWQAAPETGIVHLNSGLVRGDKLYCAHSNYPDVPMASSIEIFDTETLAHVETINLGLQQGSATWVDFHRGSWWVGFANYEGRGGAPGRGPAWSHVVRYDETWRPTGGYLLPQEVVDRFGTRSNSGGVFGPDGLLYATGHDAPEIYVLRLPDAGGALELVEILPAPAEGQGLAWDPVDPGVVYTLIKAEREVVASRLVPAPVAAHERLLIAHRGGVVDEDTPENSFAAMDLALARGYEMVEIDLRRSRDGVAVVHHDTDFMRFYGDSRRVEDLDWQTISKLRTVRGNYRPLRLEEVVRRYAGRLRFMLDTKVGGPAFLQRIEAILRSAGALESAYVIGTAESRRFFTGKALVGLPLGRLETAAEAGERVAERYFLFAHGRDLGAVELNRARALGVRVVPSINTFHYYDLPSPRATARRDTERMLSLGVSEYQIDSTFDVWLRP